MGGSTLFPPPPNVIVILIELNSVHTSCIVKTSGFTRGVSKIRGFIKFKGSLVEVLEMRKSKNPEKSPEKSAFLSLAFYNAPSLDTVDNPPSGGWNVVHLLGPYCGLPRHCLSDIPLLRAIGF